MTHAVSVVMKDTCCQCCDEMTHAVSVVMEDTCCQCCDEMTHAVSDEMTHAVSDERTVYNKINIISGTNHLWQHIIIVSVYI